MEENRHALYVERLQMKQNISFRNARKYTRDATRQLVVRHVIDMLSTLFSLCAADTRYA